MLPRPLQCQCSLCSFLSFYLQRLNLCSLPLSLSSLIPSPICHYFCFLLVFKNKSCIFRCRPRKWWDVGGNQQNKDEYDELCLFCSVSWDRLCVVFSVPCFFCDVFFWNGLFLVLRKKLCKSRCVRFWRGKQNENLVAYAGLLFPLLSFFFGDFLFLFLCLGQIQGEVSIIPGFFSSKN